jgi:hypothetical protein
LAVALVEVEITHPICLALLAVAVVVVHTEVLAVLVLQIKVMGAALEQV